MDGAVFGVQEWSFSVPGSSILFCQAGGWPGGTLCGGGIWVPGQGRGCFFNGMHLSEGMGTEGFFLPSFLPSFLHAFLPSFLPSFLRLHQLRKRR